MTKEKCITFRKDRHTYRFQFKHEGTTIRKDFYTLEEAILYRNETLALYKINPTILFDTPTKADIPTFTNAFTEFLNHKARLVKHSTIHSYYYTLNLFQRYVGSKPIDKIEKWQELCIAIKDAHNIERVTMMKAIRHIRAMYTFYIDKGVISESPIAKVTLPQNTAFKIKRRAFTEEEQERFLTVCKHYYSHYFILFLMYFQTGCRRGELPCLTYADVDTKAKNVRICKSLSRGIINGKYCEVIDIPKTQESVRDIPISDRLIFLITLQKKLKKAKDTDLIFPSAIDKNSTIAIDIITRVFNKICKKAQISDTLKLHCIRHTFASRLILKGVDLATICELGGWSNPNVLLHTYAHSNTEHKQEIMNQFLFNA